MGVEDPLGGDREAGAPLGAHAMGLPPTKPEPSILVEVAHVPHAMPDFPVGTLDLGERGGVRLLKIGVGDDLAADDDLPDLPGLAG